MSDVESWENLRCTLPVIRGEYTDDDDEWHRRVERCGSAVYLKRLIYGTISSDGPSEDGESWLVECEGGHRLYLPDDEGNECVDRLSFSVADLIGTGVVHVHESLPPVSVSPTEESK